MEYNKLSLRFKDKDLEKEIKEFFEENTRVQFKSGLIFSLISWTTAVGVIYFLKLEYFFKLASVIFLVTYPYFLFLIYLAHNKKMKNHYQWMISSTNAIAGLLLIYIFSHIEKGEEYALVCLIFPIFFGHSYKVQFYYITIASFIYVLTYQIFLLNLPNANTTDIVIFSFIIWTLQIFFLMIEYRSDLTERQLFLQRKTILKQKDEIETEQKKSEALLLNILPKSIVGRLKNGESEIADHYDNISVLFSDIVGFTTLSTKLSAEELVRLLNKIFSKFDELVETFNLEKIKTIGDAYMVVGGAPEASDTHLEKIAELALEMIDVLSEINEEFHHELNIRIGIHLGPALAGVIGSKKFVYDVWGDTINTASRMESHGLSGKINVSKDVFDKLKSKFQFESRGYLEIKGKGKMETFILKSKI